MANIDLKKIIDTVNYGEEQFEFVLAKNSDILLIVNSSDENGCYAYLNQNEETVYSDTNKVIEFFSGADKAFKTYNDYANEVIRRIRLDLQYTFDFFKNKDVQTDQGMPSEFGIIKIGEIPLDNSKSEYEKKILAISFEGNKKVKVVENGIGKNFGWCKIAFKHSINGVSTTKYGFCNRKNISNSSNPTKPSPTNKALITQQEFLKSSGTGLERLLPIASLDPLLPANIDPEKIIFDKNTASYVVLIPSTIKNFNSFGADDQEIEQNIIKEFKRVLLEATKKILEFEGRIPSREFTNDQGERTTSEYTDVYYTFAKIEDYTITARDIEPVYIFIRVPLRNILSVTEMQVKELIMSAVEAVASIPSGLQQLADNISGVNIFNVNDVAPNINSYLQSTSPNSTLDANTDFVGGLLSSKDGEYVSPKDFIVMEGRRTVIKIDQLKKTISNIANKLINFNIQITDDIESDPPKARYNIELIPYIENFNDLYIKLDEFLKQSNLGFDGLSGSIVFIFNFGLLSDIFLIPSADQEPLRLKGVDQFLNDTPFNDITFSFLLSNANSIQNLKDDEKVTDFLKEYILPEYAAAYEYLDENAAKDDEAKNCLKSYTQSLKDQAKANTNEAIANLRLKESTANLKATFSKEEWSAVADNQKKAFSEDFDIKKFGKGGGFFDPYTIEWDSIIFELTKCITDKETRELVQWLLLSLKEKLLNDKPLACQIPLFKVPKLPVIKIPPVPHLPSIVNNSGLTIEKALIDARTAALKAIVQAILDGIDACKEPDNSLKIGEANAEDLLNNPIGQLQQPLDINKQNQFKDANLFTNEEDAIALTKEIQLLLAEVSKNLTKNEILALYTRNASDKVLYVVKQIIISLITPIDNLPNLKNKLGITNKDNIYIPSKIKIIEFFAKFQNLINNNAVEEYKNEQDILASDPDLLCKEPSVIDQAFADALKKKGLSDVMANKEAQKRRDDTKRLAAALANAINMLGKDSMQIPAFNCVQNPDGTTTPGLMDKIGTPPAFDLAKEKHIETLYKPYNDNYNSDFNTWFKVATTEVPVKDDNNDITGIEFYLYKNINDIFLNSSEVGYNDKVASTFIPSFSFRKEDDDPKADGMKYAYLSKLFSKSNAVNSQITSKVDLLNGTSSFIRTSSIDSICEFQTSYLSDTSIKKIKDKNSFSSTQGFSTAIEESLKPINQQFLNDNTIKTISDGYISTLKKRYSESFYFKQTKNELFFNGEATNSSIGKSDSDEDKKETFSPITSKINLNPILTKKEVICKKPDLRLINIIDNIKKDIKKASASSSCIPPTYSKDGKKTKQTPTDEANTLGSLKLLLRIYAIDFNLKLLPFGNLLSLLKTDTFYNSCYQIFVKDLELLFGVSYKNKVLRTLSSQYVKDKKIEVTNDITFLIENGEYNLLAFIKYFKEDHFIAVNRQIKLLLKNPTNFDLIKSNLTLSEQLLFGQDFESLADFEYINAIFDTKDLEKEVQEKNDQLVKLNKQIEDKYIIYRQLGDKMSYVKSQDVVLKFKTYLDKEKILYNNDIINYIASYADNLPDSYYQITKNNNITKPSGYTTSMVPKALQDMIAILTFNNIKDLNVQVSTEEVNKLKIKLEDAKNRLEAKKREGLIQNSFVIYPNLNKKSTSIKLILEKKQTLLEQTNYINQDSNTILKVDTIEDISNNKELKDTFSTYFKYYVPLEEIFSSYASGLLMSLSSINQINSVFNSTKKSTKTILDTIEYAGDFSKDVEDDGLTKIFSKLKVLAAVPEFMVKSLAESVDPNVSVASKISLAYEAGVAAASAAGVEIPIKKLPLYVTSPMLMPLFLFPITPFGIPAILLSLKDTNSDSDTSTVTDDDKEGC